MIMMIARAITEVNRKDYSVAPDRAIIQDILYYNASVWVCTGARQLHGEPCKHPGSGRESCIPSTKLAPGLQALALICMIEF